MSPSVLSTTEQRFRNIEERLDLSAARMNSIEDLCRQLKGSTDMISGQLQQLSANLSTASRPLPGSPLPKIPKYS